MNDDLNTPNLPVEFRDTGHIIVRDATGFGLFVGQFCRGDELSPPIPDCWWFCPWDKSGRLGFNPKWFIVTSRDDLVTIARHAFWRILEEIEETGS